jgi:hypothetical protein
MELRFMFDSLRRVHTPLLAAGLVDLMSGRMAACGRS